MLAASASELVHRVSAQVARAGLHRVVLPAHGYGEDAQLGALVRAGRAALARSWRQSTP